MKNIIDYSLITNRINKKNHFSKRLLYKIHQFIYSSYKANSNKHTPKVWSLLLKIGNASNFDMNKFLKQNFNTRHKLTSKKRNKINKYHKEILSKISSKDLRKVTMHILHLVGISEKDINKNYRYYKSKRKIKQKKQNAQKQLKRRYKNQHKNIIRKANLLKLESECNKSKATSILTKWQILHLDKCAFVIDSIGELNNIEKKSDINNIILTFFNYLYYLKYNQICSSENADKLCNNLKLNISNDNNKERNKTYYIKKLTNAFKKIIKNKLEAVDSYFIINTLNGNDTLLKQYKHQIRYLTYLENKGIPIKGDYNWYFHYDALKGRQVIKNPARKFYKLPQSKQNYLFLHAQDYYQNIKEKVMMTMQEKLSKYLTDIKNNKVEYYQSIYKIINLIHANRHFNLTEIKSKKYKRERIYIKIILMGNFQTWYQSILRYLNQKGYNIRDRQIKDEIQCSHEKPYFKLKIEAQNKLKSIKNKIKKQRKKHNKKIKKVFHKPLNKNNTRRRLKVLGKNKRYTFTGTYQRCGYKKYKTHYSPTLLLTNVKVNNLNLKVTNHLWFNYTKKFLKLGKLFQGDRIQFNARVNTYKKGYGSYWTKKKDYELSYPTKIKLLQSKHKNHHQFPTDKQMVVGYAMLLNKQFYQQTQRPYLDFFVNQYQNWKKKHNIK